MSKSLKEKTSLAIFWSFIDRGGQQLIQLIFGVLLARILLTSEIGTVVLLAIFTAVANLLQESGFSSALIRKKDPDDKDFSSVFYFNISISFLIYIILYFSAPLIADFYEKPELTTLSRIIFLGFVFNAFGIIQNVILVRKMDFKSNTKVTLIASIVSGIVAVVMAMKGYGVWSLAAQQIIQFGLRSILLWLFVKWTPKASFSFSHIKAMMPYSMKLLGTSVMNQVCSNLYSNIIGKYFSMHQVGIYSQANKYSILPQTVVADGIKSAAFPALSQISDDTQYVKKAFRKTMRIAAFLSFPIAALIIVTAKSFIILLLTDKWAESIPILQILAIGAAFYPLYNILSTLLQSLGKTGLIFRLETMRNILTLALIFITINHGIHEMVISISCVSIFSFFVGAFLTGRHIEYSFTELIKDIIPYLGLAMLAILPFYFLQEWGIRNKWLLTIIPLTLGSSIYLLFLKMCGSVILHDSIEFFKQFFNKNVAND